MAEPLLIACKQGSTVSVNLQVPAGTKASGLQQLLAAANGVDVSNDVTIKVKTGTGSLSCFKNLGQLLAHDDPTVAAHWQIYIQEQKTVEELPAKTLVPIFSHNRAERLGEIELDPAMSLKEVLMAVESFGGTISPTLHCLTSLRAGASPLAPHPSRSR